MKNKQKKKCFFALKNNPTETKGDFLPNNTSYRTFSLFSLVSSMLLQASHLHPHHQFKSNDIENENETETESESNTKSSKDKMEVSFSAVGRQISPAGPDHNGNAGKSPMGNSEGPFSNEALAAKFPNFSFHSGGPLPTSGGSSALNLSSHLAKSEISFDDKNYSAKNDLISQHLQGKLSLTFKTLLIESLRVEFLLKIAK